MVVVRDGDWLSATIGDERVMMSASSGQYIGLNVVGSRIWDLIEKPRELEDICARLEAEFDVSPTDCAREVEAFLADLEQSGAITR